MKRRAFLGALAAPLVGVPLLAPALVGLKRKSPRWIAGGFVDDGGAVGHRLRDGTMSAARGPEERVPIVIAGGGMAGLNAGWELRRRGVSDFVILELESVAGGNARSGENEVSAYPWAAHYVPVPSVKSTLVRELFEELGVLRDGAWEERYLCFSPQERLFAHGEWHDGIEPDFALDAGGRAAFSRFDELIAAHRASGEFTIPMADGVRRDSPLDRISMAEWLAQHQLDTPAMRWYIDYACRDDYGALARDTSAWAGVHYFASRPHDEQGPLTWPEGNGWIAKRLIAMLSDHIRVAEPVARIERAGARWRVATTKGTYLAESVIFAAPSFLLPHVVPEPEIQGNRAFLEDPILLGFVDRIEQAEILAQRKVRRVPGDEFAAGVPQGADGGDGLFESRHRFGPVDTVGFVAFAFTHSDAEDGPTPGDQV